MATPSAQQIIEATTVNTQTLLLKAPTSLTEAATQTALIIKQHPFTQAVERWAVFACSILTVSSFAIVIACLLMQNSHVKRGIDVVFTWATAFAFLAYRSCLIFDLQEHQLYLSGDSWHKLANIFMLAEFCSLTIYLARIPESMANHFFGFGLLIIIVLQEANSFDMKNSVIILILNNSLLFVSNFIFHAGTPLRVNYPMVKRTAIWYFLSILGFLARLSPTLDFYLLADDLFMFATGMSLFYSWQTFEEQDVFADHALLKVLALPYTIRELADEKIRQRELMLKKQQEDTNKLDSTEDTTAKLSYDIVNLDDSTASDGSLRLSSFNSSEAQPFDEEGGTLLREGTRQRKAEPVKQYLNDEGGTLA